MRTNLIRAMLTVGIIGSGVLLTACNHSSDDDMTASYRVEITNLTSHQPFAPVGMVFHGSGYQPWAIGSAASGGLELLAESGDTSSFLAEALANTAVNVTDAGVAVVTPGMTGSYDVMNVAHSNGLQFSLASMLVNTNDGFTGVSQRDIGGLSMNESITVYAPVYDAGTEDNSESAATVPGQMGEGFNSAREANDMVLMHGGVVTQSDGLAGSALDESHRFDNPAARIVITRI